MKGFTALLAAIAALLVFGAQTVARAQAVTISRPTAGALFQRIGGTVDIPAAAAASGVPSGGGVEFVLDAGRSNWRSQVDLTSPYECVFAGVLVGEHTLDAHLVTSSGSRLASDREAPVGVGDVIIAMGDSITAGLYDDIPADNWSADGRIGPWVDPVGGAEYGGFEPVLSDMLTYERGYPVAVYNKAWPGDTTFDAVDDSYSLVRRHPTAATWILAYGTNDSNQGISAATYKSNLQTAIQRIRAVNPTAAVYIPKVFYWTQPVIQDYHDKVGDITRNTWGVYWGADLETLFRANHQLYAHNPTMQPGTWFWWKNTHHPDGVGVRKMAMLWQMALLERAILVTDGVLSGAGGTWADSIHVEGANSIGLSQNNLLQVCQSAPQGSPPPGTSFLCSWCFDLRLTGATSFAAPLTTTVRVEVDNLAPAGAVSWGQVWLANGSTLLPTSRAVHPRNSRNYNFTAGVPGPGQVASVVDITPPITACDVSPAVQSPDGGWYSSSPPLITLTASDSTGMAVASVLCHWDAGADSAYVGPITAPMGRHTLFYRSVDQSGNVEPEKSVTVTVTDAPSVPVVSDNARYLVKPDPVQVTWSAPDAAEYRYAIGTSPGDASLKAWTSVGTAGGISWSDPNVRAGTTVYFSVVAFGADGRSSAVGSSDGVTIAVSPDSVGAAKTLVDGIPVMLSQVVANARLGDTVYVAQADRSAGMEIVGAGGITPGQALTLVGRLTTVDGQRALADVEIRNSAARPVLRPISMLSRSLRLDSEPGAVAQRLSTHGLVVRVFGKVASTGAGWFRLWDGSLGQQKSLLVDASHLESVPAVNSLVTVSGVCGAVTESGSWTPCLIPRDSGDLVVYGVRR